MTIDIAGNVEIGRRDTNDDRAVLGNMILDRTSYSGETELPFLAAVCDGCGGYAGGGIAAQVVLETLMSEPAKNLLDSDKLAEVLERCSRNINALKEDFPEYDSMCTTVAGCVFGEEQTIVFHAGDSRVYRCDGTALVKVTWDHSNVQQMIDEGVITENEARSMSERNVINRCIGLDSPPPEIHVSNLHIMHGEIYMICSDGLWDVVGDKTICEILSGEKSLAEKADNLIYTALKNGSSDNISVCLCAGRGKAYIDENKPFVLD